MSSATLILVLLLAIEFVARLVLEIRERRLTQMRGGIFAVLRLIPLLNDIVPLPENRKDPAENEFVKSGPVTLGRVAVRLLAGKPRHVACRIGSLASLSGNSVPHPISSLLLAPGIRSRPLRLRQARQKGGQGRHAKPRRKRNPVYKIVRSDLPRTSDCSYTQSKDFEQRN